MSRYRSEGGMQPSKVAQLSNEGPTIGSSPWCGRWAVAGHDTAAREGGGGVA
jgi:hypothetical protein